ncbi:hypothetical protein IP86_02640 [Rhodopseudomonas sp. AAP120]|nr:hypothetical protein IP86_02640 [Rhodopseudomonas sp. AAP120]
MSSIRWMRMVNSTTNSRAEGEARLIEDGLQLVRIFQQIRDVELRRGVIAAAEAALLCQQARSSPGRQLS